jgi:hypothetical protein
MFGKTNVPPIYQKKLYDRGVQEVSFSSSKQTNASVSFGTDYITTSGTNANGICSVYTVSKVDLTNYNKLYFEVDYRGNSNSNYPLRLGATSNNGTTSLTFVAEVSPRPSVSSGTIQKVYADISSVSGSYYVGYRGNINSRMYAIYLSM